MDNNIQHCWILEFLLRQRNVEVSVSKRLFPILSLPAEDRRLTKAILLKRISSDTLKGLISERTLESLEMIEELDQATGINASNLMKEVYCAVAMDCTVKFLKENPKNVSKYRDAIEKIWSGRVLDMERGKEVGLALSCLQELKAQLEKALHDDSVCKYFLMEDTRCEALKLTEAFLAQVTEEIGPSFLELAARTMNKKETSSGYPCVDETS